jgi:hypothetical protein
LNARAAQDGRDKPDPQFIKNPNGWLRDEPAPARVIDQHGRPDMTYRTNGQRVSVGTASLERKRQVLREAGMLS